MLQVPHRALPSALVRRTRGPQLVRHELDEEDIVLCAGVYRGNPAILAVTDDRIFFAWVPPGVARRRDIPIRQVVAVEEEVRGRFADVTILTSHASVTLCEATRMRAWEFCRRARQSILLGSSGKRSRSATSPRLTTRQGYERRPYGPNQPAAR